MKGFGVTDIGRVRDTNQDSFGGKTVGKNCHIAVVCDGMGGAAGGSMASSISKDIYQTELEKLLTDYWRADCRDGAPVVIVPRSMREAVRRCNKFTYDLSRGDRSLSGMGTTLVSAVLWDGRVYVCNVGDSRAYAFYTDRSIQITKDHSFVQDLIDKGKMTEKQARESAKRNIITRAVGVAEDVTVDTFVLDQTADLRYILLCSDGLSNYLSSEEMKKILDQPEDMMSFERKVRFMIDLANKRGGKDNITVYLIDTSE